MIMTNIIYINLAVCSVDCLSILTFIGVVITACATIKSAHEAQRSANAAQESVETAIKSSKRASFDAIFAQIFTQHNTLRKRVADEDLFTQFINHYNKKMNDKDSKDKSKTEEITVKSIYNNFFGGKREELDEKRGKLSDFKNYFKYIYHEVTTVTKQKEEKVLDDESTKKYIQLIQAQMNVSIR